MKMSSTLRGWPLTSIATSPAARTFQWDGLNVHPSGQGKSVMHPTRLQCMKQRGCSIELCFRQLGAKLHDLTLCMLGTRSVRLPAICTAYVVHFLLTAILAVKLSERHHAGELTLHRTQHAHQRTYHVAQVLELLHGRLLHSPLAKRNNARQFAHCGRKHAKHEEAQRKEREIGHLRARLQLRVLRLRPLHNLHRTRRQLSTCAARSPIHGPATRQSAHACAHHFANVRCRNVTLSRRLAAGAAPPSPVGTRPSRARARSCCRPAADSRGSGTRGSPCAGARARACGSRTHAWC
jgi:hypothetical protein